MCLFDRIIKTENVKLEKPIALSSIVDLLKSMHFTDFSSKQGQSSLEGFWGDWLIAQPSQ
jgi:hypothetical protein